MSSLYVFLLFFILTKQFHLKICLVAVLYISIILMTFCHGIDWISFFVSALTSSSQCWLKWWYRMFIHNLGLQTSLFIETRGAPKKYLMIIIGSTTSTGRLYDIIKKSATTVSKVRNSLSSLSLLNTFIYMCFLISQACVRVSMWSLNTFSGSVAITGVHSSEAVWWINSCRHRIIGDTHHIWHYTHSDSDMTAEHTHTSHSHISQFTSTELLYNAENCFNLHNLLKIWLHEHNRKLADMKIAKSQKQIQGKSGTKGKEMWG